MSFESQMQELRKDLELASSEVLDVVEECTQETLQKGKDNIKAIGRYKDKSGKYRKGFRLTKIVRTYRDVSGTLYNSQYRLTHLLEDGHAMPGNQPDSKSYSHWKKTEESMIEDYKRRLEDNLLG